MKMRLLILIAVAIYSQPIIAMNALQEKQESIAPEQQSIVPALPQAPKELTSRSLVICFDPSHVEGDPAFSALSFGPITPVATALIQALFSKSAIIIASSGLWDFVLDVTKRTGDLSKDEQIIQILWGKCGFNPSEWLIYQTRSQQNIDSLKKMNMISDPIGSIAPDKYTMIFIPTSGLFKPYTDRLGTPVQGSLSDGELSLGIKINNLQKINVDRQRPKEGITTDFKRMFSSIPQSNDLALYLKNILFTRHDFKETLKTISPKKIEISWDIYLIGHGVSAKSDTPKIAGMPPEKFAELLTFLNDQITTRTFFYDSCYAGSNKSPYQEMSPQEIEPQNKNLNFIIIASTLFDLPSTVILGTFNFSQYFKLLNDYFAPKRDKPLTLGDAISTLTPGKFLSHRKFDPSGNLERAMQVPMIRYPHVGWFTISDFDKRLFRLNNMAILRALHDNSKAMQISKDVSVMLLDTCYIPTPIIITGDKMPLLMPVEFRDAAYFFNEINAPDISIDSTSSFSEDFLVEMLKRLNVKTNNALNRNIFFIEKLSMKLAPGNALGWGDNASEASTFKDVIINPMQSITLTYAPAGKPAERGSYNIQTQSWSLSSSSINFPQEKEAIRNASTLPEAIKNQEPITTITNAVLSQQELFKTYEHSKDDVYELNEWMKTLSDKDRKKLESYIEAQRAKK